MSSKTFFLLAIAVGLGFYACRKNESYEWSPSITDALSRAQKQNKQVLLDFTGSDWCSWCMRMQAETLTQPQFQAYSAKNLVFMEVDFPQSKPLPDLTKKQNEQLKNQLDVEGFPCFVLLNAQGHELGRITGYLPGGPTAFIAKLESFKK